MWESKDMFNTCSFNIRHFLLVVQSLLIEKDDY